MLRKLSFWAALIAAVVLARPVLAGQVTQYFPADGQAANRLTQWRVEWGIERHAAGAEVLYIKNAWFSRAPGEREVRVLGDSRIAELFTPYNQGARIYDISGLRVDLVDLDEPDLGPGCIVPGQIFGRDGLPAATGPVGMEVHDDHLRWMDTQQRSRRGQSLMLWSVLNAVNYRYVILYIFRDDGQVGFRVGATASNLAPMLDDIATHLHTGCWRVNVALDNPLDNVVKKVTLDTRASRTNIEPLANEVRFKWNPEEFTRLRVESRTLTNTHVPPHPISFDLTPMAMGAGRFYAPGEEFTLNDFWVTADRAGEIRCPRLDRYENGESLNGARPVVWYTASLLHSPRDEDFGREGYVTTDGVALTQWAGFDLKPRNFFPSTPLYP